MWLFVPVQALAQDVIVEDPHMPIVDWPAVELQVNEECSLAATGDQAAQLVLQTTDKAQAMVDAMVIFIALVESYPARIEQQGLMLETADSQFIQDQVKANMQYAGRQTYQLNERVYVSLATAKRLGHDFRGHLSRHDQAELVALCVDDRVMTMRAMVNAQMTLCKERERLKELDTEVEHRAHALSY